MEKQVVLITGAGGNLGRAVVEELASKEEVRLVCLERNPNALAALLGRLPPEVEAMGIEAIDMQDIGSCMEAVRRACVRFGRVDALVNTVGGYRAGPVDVSGIDKWNDLMALNAQTAYAISAAVLPGMQARRHGRIVHVAASPGLKAGIHQAAYAASKAAVIRLTEAIAAENRGNLITANCILPATIDTPQNRHSMPDADIKGWVPAPAIARLIAFLISDSATAVTGSAIPAGGF